MRNRLSFARREDGAAVLIVVLGIVAIFGMVVLTIDVGGLMWKRRMMVRASDAGALAAAQSCALSDPVEVSLASARADEYASANVSDAVRAAGSDGYHVGPTGGECGAAPTGWVKVRYLSPFEFIFAPLFGAPQQRDVSAEAVALWGPAGGAGAVPLELPLSGVLPCIEGEPCNFWWDNSADFDLTDSSNWGWLGLEPEQWPSSPDTNDPDRNCPAVANSDTSGWLLGGGLQVRLQGVPTYVCVDSGRGGAAESSQLFSALLSLADDPDKTWYIPVNDPDRMPTELTPGKAKYAIVGFVGMKVLDILEGDDPAAAGTPALGGHCSTTEQMTTGGTLDLIALGGGGCPNGTVPDSITGLVAQKGGGKNSTTFVGCPDTISDTTGCDYLFDGEVVTWLAPNENGVKFEFDWTRAGTEGACGMHDPDPNAFCVLMTLADASLAGGPPDPDAVDLNARGVRLTCDLPEDPLTC